MIRGTTAYFKFIMPYDYNQLVSAEVICWQEGYAGPSESRALPIVKTLAHCAPTSKSNELSVSLTPEETARFTDRRKAYIQMAATTIEGSRFGSLKKELIVYPMKGDDIEDIVTPPAPPEDPDGDGWVILDGENI